MKANVRAMFDSLALEYVRSREQQVSFRAQKRIVIDMLGGLQGRLLEVGCGPAVMTPDLLAMGFEVQGIDVSGEMVRRAEQRMAGHPLARRCQFAIGDIERLQFAGGSFNAVICMGVLEYLPRYARALAEMQRVLAPGGVVVLTVPNRASAYHVAREGYFILKSQLRRGTPAEPVAHNRCVPWKFDRELADAGLRKVQSQACNFIFFPLQELAPRASESLNRALEPLAPSAVAPLLGAQYIVKAEKTAWRSASSA